MDTLDTLDTLDTYEEALALLAAFPASLRAYISAAPPALLARKPAPDAWSVREVLAHMLHIETAVIPVRVRLMVERDGVPLPASPPAPEPAEAEVMLAEWLRAREENLALLRGLTPEQRAHTGAHQRYGPISVREHVVEWAYHDLEHLRQIAAIEAALYADIGAFQQLYPPPA
jgi:hypothetical protein